VRGGGLTARLEEHAIFVSTTVLARGTLRPRRLLRFRGFATTVLFLRRGCPGGACLL